MNKVSISSLRTVLRYIRPYSGFVILSLILAGFSVFASLYVPILTGEAIDAMCDTTSISFSVIWRILWRIGLVTLLSMGAQWLLSLCNNHVAYHVVRDMRRRAFQKLQRLPISYIDSHPYGDVVSRMVTDVDQFADGLLMGFTQLFSGVLTILGTIGFMFSLDVRITLVVMLVTPLSMFVAAFIAKRTYTLFHQQSIIRGEQTAYIDEYIGNQKIVTAFHREEETMSDFDDINNRLETCSRRAVFFSSITNPSTRFVNSLVYTGVGIFGALAAINGQISVGGLSCFLTYANKYTAPFNEISGVITEFQNALACAVRVLEFINEPPQTPDAADAKILTSPKGTVDFSHVYFSYTQGQRLIEDVNLSVKAGQRIAIVGPTGCGKTTLINLLMRFYEVTGGHIAVDDIDIRELTRHSLRAGYGMVLQDTWLKSGTIRDNLLIGRPDATDDEMIATAKAAHAHSFIRRLPKGYDTVIGEDGGQLSQGQKQLLCIARVMLCHPSMLILDEATSSIDTRTEMHIQKAFTTLMEGRTTFIVAHRLSTIREADCILVMKDGQIIEQGTHTELLAQNGFYTDLYNSQFSA